MNISNRKRISNILENISKPARIEILLAIGDDEVCVCHLEAILGYRQAYISQHLMALREAGVLVTRREGRFIFYSLHDIRMLQLIQDAGHIAGISDDVLKDMVKSEKISSCICPSCDPTVQIEQFADQSSTP